MNTKLAANTCTNLVLSPTNEIELETKQRQSKSEMGNINKWTATLDQIMLMILVALLCAIVHTVSASFFSLWEKQPGGGYFESGQFGR